MTSRYPNIHVTKRENESTSESEIKMLKRLHVGKNVKHRDQKNNPVEMKHSCRPSSSYDVIIMRVRNDVNSKISHQESR